MRRLALIVLMILLLLAACTPTASGPLNGDAHQTPPKPAEAGAGSGSGPEAWWQEVVFYEIFVRSFYDSDSNGIGDFNGITEKLDYLESLGVKGIWLMPIFPSPSYHGYDVTDYYMVNPQYGTLDDFQRLLKEAHKRDIRIIIDLVINHTSDQHPWFEASKNPHSPYRDWYLWRDTDPNYSGPWGERVWHPSASGYYYGIFESFMPDLNYRNQVVTDEMKKVAEFWLTEVGVDGFRLDAAKHLIEEGARQENTIATHVWYKREFYPVCKAANPNSLTVGELYGDDLQTIANYVGGEQFDLAFNFQLAEALLRSARTGNANHSASMLKYSEKLIPNHQYAAFLTNHDQNRVMSQLNGDAQEAKLAAFLLLTAPGTPFVYYGEEIGMTGQKPDEDIRRPMQWNASDNAGFTTARPWRAPGNSYPFVNVEAQENEPTSLLNHYRALIALRNGYPILQNGNLSILETGNSGVYAAMRTNDDKAILLLANLTGKDISTYKLAANELPLSNGNYSGQVLFGEAQQAADLTVKNGAVESYQPFKTFKTLPAYGMYILQLQP